MLVYLLIVLTVSYVYGGSSCPNRMEIYPCICMDKQSGQSTFENIVVCQGVTYGELTSFRANSSFMDIDRLLVYDSFWSEQPTVMLLNEKVPSNHLSTIRAKEIKMVDTELSAFECTQPQMEFCRLDYLKRFIGINSTIPENPNCTNIYSWITCADSIEYMEIKAGYKYNHTLKPDYFPDPLTNLKALHLPYNRITRIDRRTFTNTKFPVLEVLDLSHNLLRDIRTQFVSPLKVKILDLSYNSIRNIVDFRYFPDLQVLNLSSNHIVVLLQSNWDLTPVKLRTIDLTKNPIECNCGTKWINSTFHVSTNLSGYCSSPPEVAKMKIRKASRLLKERCLNDGSIASSRLRITTAASRSTSTPSQEQ